MLDRVLGLGCQAAHYKADTIASAPPDNCKEEENCSFFYCSACITGRHLLQ